MKWKDVKRSETPMPWKEYVKRLCFTEEEFIKDPVKVINNIFDEALKILKDSK